MLSWVKQKWRKIKKEVPVPVPEVAVQHVARVHYIVLQVPPGKDI